MPSISIGTTFVGPSNETFKTTDFLGNGAFGEVYRAVGQTSGTVVAIKLLPIGHLSSANSQAALLNEVRLAQGVKHPNVVQVLWVNNGTSSQVGPYVVMEYVSGGTLAKVLRAYEQSGEPIPLSRAIDMMIDIAQGAKAINEKVIHRDIKPDNILIEGSTLKIGDFGISKFVDESTRLHTFKGGQHIAYMAPEVWQNQTNTLKVDVYSVGLVYYQILTIRHPLLDKVQDPNNFIDWEKAHLYQQCPDVRSFRQEVPMSIAQLLSRMVSKKQDERPLWDEALKILTQPEVTNTANHPSIAAAVEAAVSLLKQQQQQQLNALKQGSEREMQLGLYRVSCDTLLQELGLMAEQFNKQFQHGQISRHDESGIFTYRVPVGRDITVIFFEPKKSKIMIRGGEVIGGGWIGLSEGRSANLVLLKHGPDDLYGRWAVCEMRVWALGNRTQIFRMLHMPADTIEPFGLKDAFFYDHIQHASGGVHVITYNFIDDVGGFFASLLPEAFK